MFFQFIYVVVVVNIRRFKLFLVHLAILCLKPILKKYWKCVKRYDTYRQNNCRKEVAMAASEENSALFPIFILTIMALPLVPYTILNLCRAASKKTKTIHCQCSECSRSGKYRKSIFKRVSSFTVH